MISLGTFFDIDNTLFCRNISAAVARRNPIIIINWSLHMADQELIGPDGIISRFKSGRIKSKEEFINLVLTKIGVSDLVTHEEFIHAWNATLQISPADKEQLQLKIKAISEGDFLVADTNLIHQEYLAELLGRDDYKEPTAEFPAALICEKILIRSYDIGISSCVLHRRDTLFQEKALQFFRKEFGLGLRKTFSLAP